MESTYSYSDRYRAYLNPIYADLDASVIQQIEQILAQTNWENPQTSLDWNNLGVIALIEAQQVEDLTLRSVYIEMALDALTKATDLHDHPLPLIHLVILNQLISSDNDEYLEGIFSYFIGFLDHAFRFKNATNTGLIYLPLKDISLKKRNQWQVINILVESDAYNQTFKLACEILCQIHLIFYNSFGLRLLNLAIQLLPDSAITHLKLGISNLSHNRQEGLFNLHRAHTIAPSLAVTQQALYLAYRDMGHLDLAQVWLNSQAPLGCDPEDNQSWRWTELAIDSPMTYVPFDESLLMAVEPSFQSIVTRVLIAEGDWFEQEMEFWRYWLKPGMTVIDVGANAGIYTFSAAKRVGATGRVFAIEPFSQCIQYLKVTKQLNQLDWVTICQGAASDRRGTIRLSLASASELNKVVVDGDSQADQIGPFEEVSCFRLDDLIDQENLAQVDWLKIDAEGHEMQVLQGSDRLLEKFMPGILYENIEGQKSANIPVAEYLQAKGYKLFRYKPFLRRLIPIDTNHDLSNILNVIALPNETINALLL